MPASGRAMFELNFVTLIKMLAAPGPASRRTWFARVGAGLLALALPSFFSAQSPPLLPKFRDIREPAGILFRHDGSPTSQKYLIETMGGGVAVADFNRDGLLDIFLVNSGWIAGSGANAANFNATAVTCTSAGGLASCPAPANTTLTLLQGSGIVLPALPAGGTVSFTVTGTAAASGSIVNVATVATPAGVTDLVPGNNSSTANTTITALADLAIVKTGPVTVSSKALTSTPGIC